MVQFIFWLDFYNDLLVKLVLKMCLDLIGYNANSGAFGNRLGGLTGNIFFELSE